MGTKRSHKVHGLNADPCNCFSMLQLNYNPTDNYLLLKLEANQWTCAIHLERSDPVNEHSC